MGLKRTYAVLPNWFNGDYLGRSVQFPVLTGSKSGTPNPGWKKRLAAGDNVSSPYAADFKVVEDSKPASASFGNKFISLPAGKEKILFAGSYTFNGFLSNLGSGETYWNHLISPSAEAEAKALARIYDRIRQDSYGVNGLLFLGELRETIHMLRNPLEAASKGLSKYLNTLKSTREQVRRKVRPKKSDSVTDKQLLRRRLDAVKDAMAGSWLELQYGIKPAISDAKDIVESAVRIYTRPDRKKRLRAKSSVEESGYNASSSQPLAECLLLNTKVSQLTTCSVQYVVGMRHSLDGPGSELRRMSDILGFQIQNFIPTAYELIPYSFLIDYFSNLGDIISAVCTDTSDVAWVVRTVRQDTRVTWVDTLASYDYAYDDLSWHPTYLNGTTSSYRRVWHPTITRTVPSSLGIPPLVLSLPGSDSTKWLNMAALIAGARDFRFRR